MTLYNLKSADGEYRITKFDDDLNPIEGSSYIVSFEECTCPAGSRPTCRHRQMLPTLIDMLDTPWFYNFETGLFEDPTGQAETNTGSESLGPRGAIPITDQDKFNEALAGLYQPEGTEAGEGPEPSTHAAPLSASPSQTQAPSVEDGSGGRGQPAPFRRRV